MKVKVTVEIDDVIVSDYVSPPVSISDPVVDTFPDDSTDIVAPPTAPEFPGTILMTVQHPSKPHALLSTYKTENGHGFPMFTAFPTDNQAHADLRIKIPNGIQLLVYSQVVKGDSDKYAYRIEDGHDNYFAGLGAVDNKGNPLNVNCIYIRKEWAIKETL